MMTFTCHDVAINDLSDHKNKGHRIGGFTGTVTVARDMGRVADINGAAYFNNESDADRVELHSLHADLTADKRKVFALFLDKEEKHG